VVVVEVAAAIISNVSQLLWAIDEISPGSREIAKLNG